MSLPVIRAIDFPKDLAGLARFLSDEDACRATQFGPVLGAGDALLWVAEQEGALVGWAVVHLRFRADLGWVMDENTERLQSGENAYLEYIEVDEAHRGRGIGRRLLATLEGEIQAQNKSVLWLHTGETNTPAQRFYEREGWTHHTTVYPEWCDGAPMRLYRKQIAGRKTGTNSRMSGP